MNANTKEPAACSATNDNHQLEQLEQVITRGEQSFVEVGEAYDRIRSGKLHKETGCKSFGAYCKTRWGHGTAYASRVINGARIARKVLELVPTLRIQEAHTRPLLRLLKKDEDPEVGRSQAVKLLVGLAQEHGDSFAPKIVKEAVARIQPPKPRKKQPVVTVLPEQAPGGGLEEVAGLQASAVEHLNEVAQLICRVDLGNKADQIRSGLSAATAQLGIVLSKLQVSEQKEAA